jgi:hypothetical protein
MWRFKFQIMAVVTLKVVASLKLTSGRKHGLTFWATVKYCYFFLGERWYCSRRDKTIRLASCLVNIWNVCCYNLLDQEVFMKLVTTANGRISYLYRVLVSVGTSSHRLTYHLSPSVTSAYPVLLYKLSCQTHNLTYSHYYCRLSKCTKYSWSVFKLFWINMYEYLLIPKFVGSFETSLLILTKFLSLTGVRFTTRIRILLFTHPVRLWSPPSLKCNRSRGYLHGEKEEETWS